MEVKLKEKFEEYLNYERMKGLSEKTIKEHKRFLDGAFSHCPIKETELEDLKLTDTAQVIEAGKQHGEYGSQRAMVVLRQYLKYLEDSGIQVPFNWTRIEVPKVPDKERAWLNKEEFKELMEQIPLDDICGLRTRALCEVLLATAMRISEALGLKKGDIEWSKKEAKIINSKNKNQERVYLSDRAIGWLGKYLAARKDKNEYIFVNKWGTNRLSPVTARNYWNVLRKRMGVKEGLSHHAFRRSLATFLIEEGADVKAVQHILRHASPRTTLRFYVGLDKKRAKEVHQKLIEKI